MADLVRLIITENKKGLKENNMKQSKIIKAYKDMEELAGNTNLTDSEQWDLYQLRKILRPHYEFQQEREAVIRERYVKDVDENGNLRGEKAKAFMKDFEDLGNMEADVAEFKKPLIRNAGVNFKTMEALEDFIEFCKAE